MSRPASVGELKEGSWIVIDGEPCRIVEYERSKPGKHGSAKARIVAIGLFDGAKRSIVSPVDAKVEVPIIDKRSGQVVSVNEAEGTVQLMDLETYEVFETLLPKEEELKSKLSPGVNVEYWKVLGRTMIVRTKS